MNSNNNNNKINILNLHSNSPLTYSQLSQFFPFFCLFIFIFCFLFYFDKMNELITINIFSNKQITLTSGNQQTT